MIMDMTSSRNLGAVTALGLGVTVTVALPKLAAAQTITDYPITTASSDPTSVAPGTDGALWFAEQNGNNIGRMTPDGVVTNEYTVPTASALPPTL